MVREPWHPALLAGVAAQLAALGVAAWLAADWYDGRHVPGWADFAGAASALIGLAGGFVAAWRPRGEDRAPVEGARWLRAFWQVIHVAAAGLLLVVASFFTDASSWPSVLLISAGIGKMLLALLTLLFVVGPVVLLTDVRRPGVDARWPDVAAVTVLMPWVVVTASSLTWAVEDSGEPMARSERLAQWFGELIGTVETREPWLAWLGRALTLVLAVLVWRSAVVSRRTIAARRAV